MPLAKLIDMPPLWLLFFLVLAWVQAQVWPVGQGFGGAAVQLIAAVLILAGFALIGAAAWAFWQHETTIIPHQTPDRIISGGIFGLSRNPIYLGDAFLLAGFALRWEAWPALILVPIFVVLIGKRFIVAEEQRMREKFGEEFVAYEQKVRRWL